MIIDYTKGNFITDIIKRKKFNVNYIDDLSYYLYLLKSGKNISFTQYGFMSSYVNRHIHYEQAKQIIRKEKINKIKSKIDNERKYMGCN